MHFTISAYKSQDWPSVSDIWQQGIDTGLATFETSPKSREAFERDSIANSAIVARSDEQGILGWAVAWPVSDRCCYAGVAEVSVYVGEAARGHGVGKALLLALANATETAGVWTLQAGIFTSNKASVTLHEKCGFRLIGHREKLGKLGDVWQDVYLMERRSQTVGQN